MKTSKILLLIITVTIICAIICLLCNETGATFGLLAIAVLATFLRIVNGPDKKNDDDEDDNGPWNVLGGIS